MNFCVTSNDHKETLEITYYFWKTLVFFPSFFVKSECASHIPIKSDTPSYDSIEMTNILRKFWQFFSASLLNYRLLSWASHWGKNPKINPKIHILKTSFLTKFTFQSLIFHKIRNFKISFFTKFTFSKTHFGQNSQFQSLIFHKIHIFQTSNSW